MKEKKESFLKENFTSFKLVIHRIYRKTQMVMI